MRKLILIVPIMMINISGMNQKNKTDSRNNSCPETTQQKKSDFSHLEQPFLYNRKTYSKSSDGEKVVESTWHNDDNFIHNNCLIKNFITYDFIINCDVFNGKIVISLPHKFPDTKGKGHFLCFNTQHHLYNQLHNAVNDLGTNRIGEYTHDHNKTWVYTVKKNYIDAIKKIIKKY